MGMCVGVGGLLVRGVTFLDILMEISVFALGEYL